MPLARAEQIRTRQAAIRADLDSLEKLEDPSDEDHVRTDALLQEWDEITEELEPLAEREQKILAVRQAMASEANRERSTMDPIGDPNVIVRNGRNGRDPWADLESVRSGVGVPSDVRARAVSAIEHFAERSDKWGLDH